MKPLYSLIWGFRKFGIIIHRIEERITQELLTNTPQFKLRHILPKEELPFVVDSSDPYSE